jgi:hypothetical protein
MDSLRREKNCSGAGAGARASGTLNESIDQRVDYSVPPRTGQEERATPFEREKTWPVSLNINQMPIGLVSRDVPARSLWGG